ncbi:hypothetical protein ACH6EH_04250 [Paenibacillus sp. JSM ZJ436]
MTRKKIWIWSLIGIFTWIAIVTAAYRLIPDGRPDYSSASTVPYALVPVP